jgi:hypothetical protein
VANDLFPDFSILHTSYLICEEVKMKAQRALEKLRRREKKNSLKSLLIKSNPKGDMRKITMEQQ